MTRTPDAGAVYQSMADVRAANERAGMHFFSRETMRFWKSRVESALYVATQCFVTSETEWALDGRTPRRIYAVRRVRPDATMETLASHLSHIEDARAIAKSGIAPKTS